MVKRYDAPRATLLHTGATRFPSLYGSATCGSRGRVRGRSDRGRLDYSVTRYMRKTDSTVSTAIFTSNQSDQFSM